MLLVCSDWISSAADWSLFPWTSCYASPLLGGLLVAVSAGTPVLSVEAQLSVLEESVQLGTAPTVLSGQGERGALLSIRKANQRRRFRENFLQGFR